MSGLETLAAVSSILQTISFASEVYSLCHEFYSDRPVAFDTLKSNAADMEAAIASLEQHIEQLQATPPSADDKRLLANLQTTRHAAGQLKTEVAYVLEKRQAGSVAKAFRTHFRYMRRKSNIAALKASLEDCDRTTKLILANRDIKTSDAILLQNSTGFSDLSDLVKERIQELIDKQNQASKTAEEHHQALNADLASLSVNVTQSHAVTREHIDQISAWKRLADAHKQLLGSLEFPNMWQRQNQIVDPGEASFEKAFFRDDAHLDSGGDEESSASDEDSPASDEGSAAPSEGSPASGEDSPASGEDSPVSAEDSSEFGEDSSEFGEDSSASGEDPRVNEIYKVRETTKRVQEAIASIRTWIETGTTPFWVSGHAGSGKSTLLKFLADQERQHATQCPELNKEVLTHYFWKPGSDMQQNKKGLYCSLVHQLLDNDPERSERLLLDMRVSQKKSASDWSNSELERAFGQLVSFDKSRTIIIIVDGLDEITEDGDLRYLLDMLGRGQWTNCRYLISGRPEFIIEKHLSRYPTIRVQELTYPTMAKYTASKLDDAVASREWGERAVTDLYSTIAEKAEGIFLWLVVVTDMLWRSIWKGKAYDDVLERVDELPTRLEPLFADMWKRMDADSYSDRRIAMSYINAVIVHQQLMRATWGSESLEATFGMSPPSLMNVLFMADPEGMEGLLSGSQGHAGLDWLEPKREELMTHCLGLLLCSRDDYMFSKEYWEKEPRPEAQRERVVFAHRTVFDFFTKSDAGLAISLKSNLSQPDALLLPIKALILEFTWTLETIQNLDQIDFFNQTLIAVAGLSQAVSADYGVFAQARDLLHELYRALYRWRQPDPDFHAFIVSGRSHIFDMLVEPSFASSEAGTYLFSDYWAGYASYIIREPWHQRIPPQLFVDKMLQAGACPHRIARNHNHSACREFVLQLWKQLVNEPMYQQFGHGLSRAEGAYSLGGYWASLHSFLGTNPGLDSAKFTFYLDGSEPNVSGLKSPAVREYTGNEEFYFHNDKPEHFNKFGMMPVMLRFSVDLGWLCRHSLALGRRRQELGLDCEDDISYLPRIEKRLSQLEEQNGYQAKGLENLYVFEYVKAENTLLWRCQFDEYLAACVTEYVLKQFERALGKSPSYPHRDILWASQYLLSTSEGFSVFGVTVDEEARSGNPANLKLRRTAPRSEMIHRIDLEHVQKQRGWHEFRDGGFSIESPYSGLCKIRFENVSKRAGGGTSR